MIPARSKILCVCEGGNCRSVTMATLLKYYFRGHFDVLAMSLAKNSIPTKLMLYHWADLVLTVAEDIDAEVREEARVVYGMPTDRIRLIPIGRDMWGKSMHPEFVPVVHKLLVESGFEPTKSAEEIVARSTKFSARRRGEE